MKIERLKRCSQHDKLLLNGKMHWQFLDSWTFTDWKATDAFLGKICIAEGIVLRDDSSYVAQLQMTWHDDIRCYSLLLCMKDDANKKTWDDSVNVTTVEKEAY